MGDHRDAHAMERALVAAPRDLVDDLGHRHRGPVDADEVAVGVVAIRLAVPRKAAVGAVRAAAFRVSEQQVQAPRAAAAVHPAGHDAERDRRRVRHLHVLGRAHLRRQHVVVRQVHALRRDGRVFHAPAVAGLDGRGQRHSRLHVVERIEGSITGRHGVHGIRALLDATHVRSPACESARRQAAQVRD